MKQEESKIKYFLYARKSSEAEDRQVASIEAQVDELTKIAKQENLKVSKVFRESRSAKAPGRPLFAQIMERIQQGEAQGILCWKLDRLARNPIDGGQISWLLQQGVIKHIQTYGRGYYPTDNVLIMSVELGMANQFILDLSTNTKRGLRAKAEKGWFPGLAPIGYINDKYSTKGEKTILKDQDRFPLMRRMWDILLTNQHSVQKIYETATKEWGLTIKRGKPISRSKVYEFFTNPFYYGTFYHGGVLYKGKHEPMITEKEYDRAQVLLGRRSNPRAKTHFFAFTGMIRCGECGAMITAEEKIKYQKNGNIHHYTYYRCTKRKDPDCNQKPIEVKKLEAQIVAVLDKIEIPPEFHDWALDCLKEENKKEVTNRNNILKSQQKAYERVVKKIDGLIDMRVANELTEAEFKRKKAQLTGERVRLQGLLNDTDHRVDKWLENAERVFDFARDAQKIFKNGDLQTKKQILAALGSNLLLKDRKLSIDVENALLPIMDCAKEVKDIHDRLEPPKNCINKKDFEQIYAQNPVLGG